jgi:hypothetical protein
LVTYARWPTPVVARENAWNVALDLAAEAATPAERQEQRDARPALSERYRSHADYVARVALRRNSC